MSPTQAIELARRELVAQLDAVQRNFRRYVWQASDAMPEQGDPWAVFEYGPPPDKRPYYVVQVTGQAGESKWTSQVELFNKPDYLRPTIWDRLTGRTDPPSR